MLYCILVNVRDPGQYPAHLTWQLHQIGLRWYYLDEWLVLFCADFFLFNSGFSWSLVVARGHPETTLFQGDRVGAPPKHDLVHKFINPCKKNPDKGREGTTNSDDVVHEGPTEKKTIIGSSFEGSFGFFTTQLALRKRRKESWEVARLLWLVCLQ